jgi:2-polyprenyl-3-methyl-5-hydroxy-6-metoxy-1,4-benzoquinol methylase
MWLAQRGLEVTMLDVSSEALKLAGTMARERGLHLNLSKVDLEQNTPPAGPWDLIIVVNYCQRDLYRTIAKTLTPGGVIAVVQATTKNLERHKSPSARFLIEHREIEMLFDDLTTLHNKADWMKNGRHEVTLVVQRDSVTV